MKSNMLLAFFLCIASLLSSPAMAADGCKVVLYMYGKATGNGGGIECSPAERSFFNIVKRTNTVFSPAIQPMPVRNFCLNVNQRTRRLSTRLLVNLAVYAVDQLPARLPGELIMTSRL